jgi:gamma-glutamyltranspeptidase/glutathione hydrolase
MLKVRDNQESFMKKILGFLPLFFATLIHAESQYPISAHHAMVVTEQHLATQAGLEILKKGGNAVDAAVAVGYALAVVQPCCGNLGGGGFLLLRERNGKNYFLNFREIAPGKLKREMFINEDGSVNGNKLNNSYLGMGVPGTVMGLNTALKRFGTLSLAQVMAPAIRLAKNGFKLDETNAKLFTSLNQANIDANVKKIFTQEGQPYSAGQIFKQPELAKTLEIIAAKGSKGFYQGEIAEKLALANQENGGVLSVNDLAQYRVKWEKPLQCHYHSYQIITAPLPSSGGITLCEMLAILQNYPMNILKFHSPQAVHHMAEAMRFAYADRINNLGDPDFVKDPTAQLLDPKHIQEVVARINPHRKSNLPVCQSTEAQTKPHTTHYSILDTHGNAVAVTYTINDFFGIKRIAKDTGFLLNDEMDDFTIIPHVANHPNSVAGGAANLLEPYKRPLSSTAPTIVAQNGHTVIVTGSPGGATISTTVLQVLVNFFDFKMNLQQAVAAARFHHQCTPDLIYYEPGAFSAETINQLKQKDYFLHLNGPFNNPTWGAASSIWNDYPAFTLYGASDPRRPDGSAAGF